MAFDMKRIGEAVRDAAGEDERDSTVVVRRHDAGGDIMVAADPEGEVDISMRVPSGDSEVYIHRGRGDLAEAIVKGPSGDMRFYRLEGGPEGFRLSGAVASEADRNMIQSASAMFGGALGSIEKLEGFERFNPYEEEMS